jgi:hypothetical protein
MSAKSKRKAINRSGADEMRKLAVEAAESDSAVVFKEASAGNILATAYPPSGAIVLFLAVSALCWAYFPSAHHIAAAASRAALTTSPFVSQSTLATVRATFASFIFGTQAFVFFGPGWNEKITYTRESKLKLCEVPIRGFRTLLFFTVWCWLLLGVYFAGSAFLGFNNAGHVNPSIMSALLLTWEVACPNSFLVSVVITYVIWPRVLKNGGPKLSAGLKLPIVLIQHNANVVMVAAELVLSRTPVLSGHAAAAPVFGLIFVLFSWVNSPYVSPEDGAVYLYFFLDPTPGTKFACISLIGLLGCLLAFYVIAIGVDVSINYATDASVPLLMQISVVALLTRAVCRFRD